MRTIALLLIGIAIGVSGWWMVSHWGAFLWWTWLAIGLVSGLIVGIIGGVVVTNVMINDSISRAFGW